MTSIIDSQSVDIEQLVIPICVGATTNNPSLLPYAGSLCYDYTTPGVLYTGSGIVWTPGGNTIGPGIATIDNLVAFGDATGTELIDSGVSITSAIVSNITFSKSGQPSLSNCSTYCTKTKTGTLTMVTVDIYPNQAITPTSNGDWLSDIPIVPDAYLPTSFNGYNAFPYSAQTSGGTVSGIFLIDNAGYTTIIVNNTPLLNLPWNFIHLSCSYHV